MVEFAPPDIDNNQVTVNLFRTSQYLQRFDGLQSAYYQRSWTDDPSRIAGRHLCADTRIAPETPETGRFTRNDGHRHSGSGNSPAIDPGDFVFQRDIVNQKASLQIV